MCRSERVSSRTKESVVDITGEVMAPEEPVASCTQQDVEIGNVVSIKCISRSVPVLPFQIEDAARSELDFEKEDTTFVRVGQDTRLNHRVIDLRTPANQAIFRVQSAACELFRDCSLYTSPSLREWQKSRMPPVACT